MATTHEGMQRLIKTIFISIAGTSHFWTRREIAKLLERSKSPELIEAIEYLVDHGYLEKFSSRTERGTLIYNYRSTVHDIDWSTFDYQTFWERDFA